MNWYDLRNIETQEIHRLVMVTGDLGWMDGRWVSISGFEILEED